MAYITVEQLREAASPNGVNENTAAELLDEQLLDVIRQATEHVDAYTKKSYRGQPVPPLVQALTIGVALYIGTLMYRQGRDIPADDPVVRRYAQTQSVLNDMARGVIPVPLDAGSGGADEDSNIDGTAYVWNPYEGSLFDEVVVQRAVKRGAEYGWIV